MEWQTNWFSLKGKVAIVTGGNTGLGLAYVDALSKAGADIMIAHFEPEIEEAKRVVEKNGRKVAFWKGDLTQEKSPQLILDKTLEEFNRVDILVNNAGMIARDPILIHSKEKWDRVININLTAVFRLSQVIGRQFVKQKSGKIINIASMHSFQGNKNSPGYTASKHGICGITKAFTNELAVDNVQINAIAPGYIRTPMIEERLKDPEYYKERMSRIPTKKIGELDDLKGVVVFLASKASDYINGITICVDGGVQSF